MLSSEYCTIFVLLWSVWCKLKISSVKPLKISNIVSFSTMLGWIGMYMYMAWTQNWIISLDCLVFTRLQVCKRFEFFFSVLHTCRSILYESMTWRKSVLLSNTNWFMSTSTMFFWTMLKAYGFLAHLSRKLKWVSDLLSSVCPFVRL